MGNLMRVSRSGVIANSIARVISRAARHIPLLTVYMGICTGICAATAPIHATSQAPPSIQVRCIDITNYGADRSGVRDNAAAFRSALAAADSQVICIHFPAGTYRFASSPRITLRAAVQFRAAAVTITGDGAGVSKLKPDPDVNGLIVELTGPQQSFHIRDLSILAGNKSRSADGIAIRQERTPLPNPAQSDITGVSIHGSDGVGAANRFAHGIFLDQVSNVGLINVAISGSPDGGPYASEGTCLLTQGRADAIPVQINIVASQLNYCGKGIVYGPYVQGIQIVASNFVGNATAVYQPPNSPGNDQLSISASQFNSGQRNIFLQSPIDGVSISASDFYLSDKGVASVEMPGVQFAIQGNCFIQLGKVHTIALVIGAYMIDAGVVTGNTFKNFDVAINLRHGSRKVNVQSNAYSEIASTPVLDQGTENSVGGGSL